MNKKLLIVSASGGLDSTTLLYKGLKEEFDVITIGFNYGQKNFPELISREEVLQEAKDNFDNYIMDIPINISSILEQSLEIYKKLRDSKKIKDESGHEFYTPSRNLLFGVLTTVVGEISALALNYDEVFIGMGIHKHSEEAYGENKDYWDITPEFAQKFQELLSLNDVKKVSLWVPFVDNTKSDIVEEMIKLNVPYKKTWTCYDPKDTDDGYYPCLKCEACVERKLAGDAKGIIDINDYKVIKSSKDDSLIYEFFERDVYARN